MSSESMKCLLQVRTVVLAQACRLEDSQCIIRTHTKLMRNQGQVGDSWVIPTHRP